MTTCHRYNYAATKVTMSSATAPDVAASYRQRVLDPVAEQIRHWARAAEERGEIDSHALQHVPLLLLSPAILATMWNGLYPDEPMRIATTFETFLDLVFGG